MQTVLTHYTTKTALEKILQPDGSMTLQATHIHSFADYSEGALPDYAGLLKRVSDKMSLLISRLENSNPLPQYKNALQEIQTYHNEALNKISKVNHFVISFSRENYSEHASIVAMWRLYAEDANGVCLVFDYVKLQKLFADEGARFDRVEYEPPHKQLWRNTGEHLSEKLRCAGSLESASERGIAVSKEELVNYAKPLFDFAIRNFQEYLRFKHQAYTFEKEERAIFLDVEPSNDRVSLRGGSKIPTPRLDFKLTPEATKDCLLEVVFGPGVGYLSDSGKRRLESQIPFFRSKYQLPNEVKLTLSDIPFFSS